MVNDWGLNEPVTVKLPMVALLDTVKLVKIASGEERVEAMVSLLILALSVTVKFLVCRKLSEIKPERVWMVLAVVNSPSLVKDR